MIALPTEFPFIRVNAETLALCESAWLRETLRTAAAKTQDVPPWLAEDVSKGVEAFLRNHYEGTVIEVADLFERIRAALENLGLNHMAAEVETVVPPVRISLADLARRAGAGYELAFFRLLDDRLRASADGGVRTVVCYGLRRAVKQLASAEKWSARCRVLEDEITSHVNRALCGRGPVQITLRHD
ncbi:MAG: hypothetical protein KDM91_21120 [Verrucomicrobiae bacterium]|nr:hypothetical protein [Verrucomicrobiae bacterium]MCP5541257.1 hypothetical protein [Akkermansiaceae bacterium]